MAHTLLGTQIYKPPIPQLQKTSHLLKDAGVLKRATQVPEGQTQTNKTELLPLSLLRKNLELKTVSPCPPDPHPQRC